MKKLMVISMLLIGLCGCNAQESSQPPACEIGQECESNVGASDSLKWPKVSLEESIELLKEDGILFFSFDDCPYCVEARPILESMDLKLKISYVDVKREERDPENKTYQAVYEILKPELDKGGYDKIYMPTVAVIKDGKLKGIHVGTVDGHSPKEAKMTTSQQDELKAIYQKLIEE